MDTLYVNDIRAYGYTGAIPEENVLGQWFRVDLVLRIDLTKAGSTDRLADTYNYAVAVQLVQQLIQQRPFKLVEAVASEIAKAVLQSDERLEQITVKLTKLTPPVPHFSGNITVEITRDRAHIGTPSPAELSRGEWVDGSVGAHSVRPDSVDAGVCVFSGSLLGF